MDEPIILLLRQAVLGDSQAADRLFRLVEQDLRAIAVRAKQGFPADMDAPTSLIVNEAFLRMLSRAKLDQAVPEDRRQFFCFAATKIHNLLVEIARHKRARKRGGDLVPAEEGVLEGVQSPFENPEVLMDLEAALEKLERFAWEEATVFRTRWFLGCTFDEIATILNISATSAKRGYASARAWLKITLKEYDQNA